MRSSRQYAPQGPGDVVELLCGDTSTRSRRGSEMKFALDHETRAPLEQRGFEFARPPQEGDRADHARRSRCSTSRAASPMLRARRCRRSVFFRRVRAPCGAAARRSAKTAICFAAGGRRAARRFETVISVAGRRRSSRPEPARRAPARGAAQDGEKSCARNWTGICAAPARS